MKNHIKSLLAASLLVSSVAQADNVSNRTYMQTQSPGLDLARQDSIWHRQLHRSKPRRHNRALEYKDSRELDLDVCNESKDKKYGAHFQATGFFKENTNKSGIGKRFGFGGKNTLVVGTAGAGVDIDSRNLIFNHSGATNTLAGTLSLRGKQQVGGVEFDWYQNLDCLWKGLYFLLSVPVVHVKNKLELNVTGQTTQTIAGTAYGVADYFNGNISQAAGSNQQAALSNALITGSTSETGVADVHLMVGWDFYRTKMHHVSINVGADFPTGNESHGKKAFQAIVGNGNHYTVGAGITASTIPWKTDHQAIEFYFDVRYRYLFKGDETRTVGIKTQNWGQYQFLGQTGVLGVVPAANVLTRKVSVTPRNQLNATALIAYNIHGFTVDVGYEVLAQEAEKVKVKSWTNDTYALAGNNYDGTVAFSLATNVAASTQTIGATAAQSAGASALQSTNLDTKPATTDGYVTNKIYSAVGYRWAKWCCPLMVKAGGYYEFAPSRKATENWSVFGGLAVNF